MSGGTGTVSTGRSGLGSVQEPSSGAGTASNDWPLVSALEFGSLPTAVACARAHTRSVLAEWGLSHLVDDAVTLTSELVTNALQASWTLRDRPPVVLRLLANDRQLLIEAWDQCTECLDLAPRASSDAAEGGRGLLVVAALSNRWGVGRMGTRFKVVWARAAHGQRTLMRLSICAHCGRRIARCPHADDGTCGYSGWYHVLDGEHYCDDDRDGTLMAGP